jgi:hypothetical protein
VSRRRGLYGLALALVYLAGFAGIAWLYLAGREFYETPLLLRARHPDFWRLKAGGSLGHALGIAGTAMMIAMLAYSLRKRVSLLRRLGPLRIWLDVHILLGVFGPLLVVLHSSFKVQGLVALSFWSMVVVATSGVLGRFLYMQIPRTRAGEELTLAELVEQDRKLGEALVRSFGLDEASLARLDALAATRSGVGLVHGLLRLPLDALQLHRGLLGFERECPFVPRILLREFRRVLRAKAFVRRRIEIWDRIHELFHYWHVLHKPFAVVMILFMVVHVAVAFATGYGFW